jgi:PAS domain S-box-containing protein
MPKNLRVLLVEDSEDDAHFMARELKQSGLAFESHRVDTLPALEAALTRESWDLVISDHTLPGFDSLRALELVKEKRLDIPFIVVSGTIGEEVAVKAMKAGASDYVMKDHLARLAPSIERELREAATRRAKRSAEEALRRSEQELSDFFEHACVGLQWAGPDGTILRVNQAELDMLGYSHDEYAGHSITEFYADPSRAKTLLALLHAGDEVTDFEARLRCRNGTIKHVLINANVLWEGGKFIHSRCFTRDITDRKRGEEARSYLAAIVESSDDAIIGTSLDGVIRSWNAAAVRRYGYSEQEVRDCSVSVLTPEHRPQEWPQIYEQVRSGGHTAYFETVRRRKNGTTVEVAVTLSPIMDERGNVTGISAIEHDITIMKREENERLMLINELTAALARVKTLSGLLPICASCKKIRDDSGYWKKIETYISERTEAEFTHGICPDCMTKLYPQYASKTSSKPEPAAPPVAKE